MADLLGVARTILSGVLAGRAELLADLRATETGRGAAAAHAVVGDSVTRSSYTTVEALGAGVL